jgi:hypothetical protein
MTNYGVIKQANTYWRLTVMLHDPATTKTQMQHQKSKSYEGRWLAVVSYRAFYTPGELDDRGRFHCMDPESTGSCQSNPNVSVGPSRANPPTGLLNLHWKWRLLARPYSRIPGHEITS